MVKDVVNSLKYIVCDKVICVYVDNKYKLLFE